MSAWSVRREMSVWNVRREMSTEEVNKYYGRKTIVCNNGSAFVKAAIVDGRQVIFPNVVGRSSHTSPQLTLTDSFYVGEEATLRPGLRIRYPIQHVIVHMQEMKTVWEHVFYEKLQIDPSNYSLIIMEASLPNQKQSLDMLQEMFDTFGFKAVLLVVAPLLTMYSNRYSDGCTGIVVEIGDGLTQVVPIYGGSVAGRDITDLLEELLGIQSISSEVLVLDESSIV